MKKALGIAGVALLLGAGVLSATSKPQTKPLLDSSTDTQIAEEQAVAVSKGKMVGGKVIGPDSVERTIIPYDGPKGKGYIIEYKKDVVTTDKNGSTTIETFRQQKDFGPEGRTQLW